MDLIGMVSLACLLITGLLAAWAVFSHHYDDTLLQRVGLSIVAIGCATRAFECITETVPNPPAALLWSQIGLAMYAVGTALRVYVSMLRSGHNRRRPRNRRGLPPYVA
jgi:hypothetical protein